MSALTSCKITLHGLGFSTVRRHEVPDKLLIDTLAAELLLCMVCASEHAADVGTQIHSIYINIYCSSVQIISETIFKGDWPKVHNRNNLQKILCYTPIMLIIGCFLE